MKFSRYFQYFKSMVKIRIFKLKNDGKINIFYSCIFQNDTEVNAEKHSVIKMGHSCVVSRSSSLTAFGGGKLDIGDKVFFNKRCQIVAKDSIKIGSNTTIGSNTLIYDHDHDIESGNRYVSKAIEIGQNVWIGAGVIILKGVVIGNNSVVAAGAIVTHNIPDQTIYMNKIQPVYKKLG